MKQSVGSPGLRILAYAGGLINQKLLVEQPVFPSAAISDK
jgi:hypothetical protein